MSIRIIEEPEIVLTRAEYERLQRAWQKAPNLIVSPSSFESFVRAHQKRVREAIDRVRPS